MFDHSTAEMFDDGTASHHRARPPLDRNLEADVVVIGGGIVGATAAYLFKRAGKRVVLLERNRCGAGRSGRSAALVTSVTHSSVAALVESMGPAHARETWDAGVAAISRVRSIVRDERINCEFGWVRGCLYAPPDADPFTARAGIAREMEVDRALGLDVSCSADIPGIGQPGVFLEGQARLHPLRYLGVLVDRIEGDGSRIFEQTDVCEVDTRETRVTAGGFCVAASYIVMATETPLLDVRGLVGRYRPSGLAVSPTFAVSGTAPRGALADGVYWEHGRSLHDCLCVDQHRGHVEVTLGAVGATFGDDAPFARLEQALAARVPGVRMRRRWSGHVIETRDGLPCIGEVAPRLFAATGFGSNGMTFGTLAGMMAVDAQAGRKSPWRDLFDIRRSGPVAADFEHECQDTLSACPSA